MATGSGTGTPVSGGAASSSVHERNLYCSLDAAKRTANTTSTARDTVWLEKIEAASRRIDLFCGRHFYTMIGIRYFDAACRNEVWVDDFLALSALAMDSELDGTFDGEAWTEGVDWVSRPYNQFPKCAIELHVNGNYSFTSQRRYIKATGTWGYGDGRSASPWSAIGVTGTLSDASDTSMVISVSDGLEVGQTVQAETEQIYISAVSGTTATVVREMNGTTAAAHSAVALYAAQYPPTVVRACATLAGGMMARDGYAGFKSERIGDYQYTLADEANDEQFLFRALGGLVKPL